MTRQALGCSFRKRLDEPLENVSSKSMVDIKARPD